MVRVLGATLEEVGEHKGNKVNGDKMREREKRGDKCKKENTDQSCKENEASE